ncbi:squalene monooxygenase-like protein [Tanacetum coccineum]
MSASDATSAIYHGHRVDVIERDLTEYDRIVGELLQLGAYLKLIEFGLDDCVDGIEAQQVFGYAIYRDGENTKLSYPLEKFKSDIFGRSYGYGRFIQRMREKATTLPKYAFFPLILTCNIIHTLISLMFTDRKLL